MPLRRRQFLRLASTAAALPFAPYVARAQAWPATKAIRLIVPFSAGSTVDVVGRLLIEPLSQQLRHTVLLENLVGDGGTTGATMVARADPDGHTILVNTSAHSAIPAIYAKVPYDTARDFAAVASLGSSSNVTVVSPKKGFKTLKDLVAAAKSRSAACSHRSSAPNDPAGRSGPISPATCTPTRASIWQRWGNRRRCGAGIGIWGARLGCELRCPSASYMAS